MELLDRKTNDELLKSLLAEIAKANNEIRCSRQDTEKALNRLNFALVLINTLINREED
jgi:hypothetical protein